jgi:tetratricopeptide (TPR) repeat protein
LKAIGLNSNAGFARYLLGVTYYKLGKYSDSESTLIRALELEPNLGDIRLALANVYMRVQDWPKALLSLDRYLKENPKAANRENILAKRQQVERIANGTK